MTLLVGIGNPERGDDGAGPAVAARVAALDLPGVRVVPLAAPTRLIELWAGESHVVVVDAVLATRDGGNAGDIDEVEDVEDQVLVFEVADRALPAWPARGGTHGFGVPAVVELARSMRRMPERLTLVGVPGHRFEHGRGLSCATKRAVEAAVAIVLARCGPGSASS